MSSPALDTYLEGADPAATKLLTSLDESIRAACPDLDVAIKYGILMYGLRGDWRTWVCALQATKKGVSLKFLYGVLLDDPLRVLRSGSSADELGLRDGRGFRLGVCPSVRRRGGGQVRPVQDDSTAGARGEPSGLEGAQGPVGPDAARSGQIGTRQPNASAVTASAQPQESMTPLPACP